jgi:predicted dehydrogenase
MRRGVGIIGAGLIGNKRADAIVNTGRGKIIIVADIDKNRAEDFAHKYDCYATRDWKDVVSDNNVNIVIVSVINKFLAPISIAALEKRKHVLCEKPLGRNVLEAETIVRTAQENRVLLKTGFNHRYYPAISRAKELFDRAEVGKLLFIRARYGHGGRPGMEKEWRANKELCGGGELLDQGVHIIDLCRWFAGSFDEVFGVVETKFWNIEVEDNVFAIMKNNQGITVQFHVSWTNWKNIFSFEVFGDKGFLHVEGRGGSYGKQFLTFGRRRAESGLPDVEVFDFPSNDVSWEEEWKDFMEAVENKRQPLGSGLDGLEANRVVEAIYESARKRRVIRLK